MAPISAGSSVLAGQECSGTTLNWQLAALSNLQSGVIILNRCNEILFVNDWFLKRSGMTSDELVGQDMMKVFDGLASQNFLRRLAISVQTGFPAMLSHSLHAPPLPLYMPHLVGQMSATLSQTVHIVPMGKRGSDAMHTLIQITDVTPTVRRESMLRTHVDQMHLMARVDALTGVGNRRAFSEALETEVRAAIRAKTPLGLLMMDIDHFKAYNDRYGHPAGDQCIKEVATVIQQSIRRPRDLLSRYGGEEFAVLLPATPIEGVVEVGREVLEQVRRQARPHMARSDPKIVTVSIGAAALVPVRPDDAGALLRQADEALYVAKRDGRNRLSYQGADTSVSATA